ncbi:MAG: carboxypeptidase regulatory-like domain-containing protein [bacterium]
MIDSFFIGSADLENIEDGYSDYFEPAPSETPGKYSLVLPPGDLGLCMYTFYSSTVPGGGCAILHDWKRLILSKGDVEENINFTATTTNLGNLEGGITVPSGYDSFPQDWCLIYAARKDNPIVTPLKDAVAFPGYGTSYKFKNLPAGTYTLTAYARNLASVMYQDVTVTAGNTATRNITFSAGGILKGKVTGESAEAPIESALVTILENGKKAFTDSSGNYEIRGISEKTYTVKVNATGYAAKQSTIVITSGETTTQDFSLSATIGSISGTVKNSSGGFVNSATVLAYNLDDNTCHTDQTVGGAFSIADLIPGKYILVTSAEDYKVTVYPAADGNMSLAAQENKTGVEINIGEPSPPAFTVRSAMNDNTLSMEFFSDKDLNATPLITVDTGNGSLGTLTQNNDLNHYQTGQVSNLPRFRTLFVNRNQSAISFSYLSSVSYSNLSIKTPSVFSSISPSLNFRCIVEKNSILASCEMVIDCPPLYIFKSSLVPDSLWYIFTKAEVSKK